jgi:hypothetical protein
MQKTDKQIVEAVAKLKISIQEFESKENKFSHENIGNLVGAVKSARYELTKIKLSEDGSALLSMKDVISAELAQLQNASDLTTVKNGVPLNLLKEKVSEKFGNLFIEKNFSNCLNNLCRTGKIAIIKKSGVIEVTMI